MGGISKKVKVLRETASLLQSIGTFGQSNQQKNKDKIINALNKYFIGKLDQAALRAIATSTLQQPNIRPHLSHIDKLVAWLPALLNRTGNVPEQDIIMHTIDVLNYELPNLVTGSKLPNELTNEQLMNLKTTVISSWHNPSSIGLIAAFSA